MGLDTDFIDEAKKTNKVVSFSGNFEDITDEPIRVFNWLYSTSEPSFLEVELGFIHWPQDKRYYFVSPKSQNDSRQGQKLVTVLPTREHDYQVEMLERIAKYISRIPGLHSLSLRLPEELRDYVGQKHVDLLGEVHKRVESSPIHKVGYGPDRKRVFCEFLIVGEKS